MIADSELDVLVVDLGRIYRHNGMKAAVEMGQLIVERLYGGNHDKWRSRGPKDVSFRKLERHPGLPFRASTLSRAVAIYMLARRLGALPTFEHLSVSHLHEVAGLSCANQDQLLAQADRERWSVMRLRKEAAGVSGRTVRKKRGPVSIVPRCVLWLRQVRRDLETRAFMMDIEAIERLSLSESEELLETVRLLFRQGELLARKLDARLRHLKTAGPNP
jgi:hypothetical protein